MIPDYQTLMLPLLKFTADGEIHTFRDAVDSLANEFNLTEEERKQLLPSGQQGVFHNRVGWARTFMKKAGLLDSPKRAMIRITDRGREVLKHNPPEIDADFLKQNPEFMEFLSLKHEREETIPTRVSVSESSQTPEELLEYSYSKIREDLANNLLAKVKECDPSFFEHLVIDLRLAMGYGGSRAEAGKGDREVWRRGHRRNH